MRYARVSMPAVFISGSGSVFVDGRQPAACVMIVLSMPAPLSVIPALGSKGASSSNVPAAISIVAPSVPSRTAATSTVVLSTGGPAKVTPGTETKRSTRAV
jgi:hypothetical protein